MLEHWADLPGLADGAARGRRTLDRAEGILVALRGCSAEDAFVELFSAARDSHQRLSTITAALLDVASQRDAVSSAHDLVRERWGALLSAGRNVGRQ